MKTTLENAKALGVPGKEITQGQHKAVVSYHERRFGVKGRVIARGRVVRFGPFTLALRDGHFEGCEYVVYQLPDGVLEAEVIETGAGT